MNVSTYLYNQITLENTRSTSTLLVKLIKTLYTLHLSISKRNKLTKLDMILQLLLHSQLTYKT